MQLVGVFHYCLMPAYRFNNLSSFSIATFRSLAFPMRRESTMTRSSYNPVSFLAASDALGYSGIMDCPLSIPKESFQTYCSPLVAIVCLIISADDAVGTPRTMLPGFAGKQYLIPYIRKSRSARIFTLDLLSSTNCAIRLLSNATDTSAGLIHNELASCFPFMTIP